tara:strand:+ start:429 stop:656 length:228 start_codon:yes stop_codon:yes gene_type:complete
MWPLVRGSKLPGYSARITIQAIIGSYSSDEKSKGSDLQIKPMLGLIECDPRIDAGKNHQRLDKSKITAKRLISTQ